MVVGIVTLEPYDQSINQHIYLNITATVAGFKKHTRISEFSMGSDHSYIVIIINMTSKTTKVEMIYVSTSCLLEVYLHPVYPEDTLIG